MQVHFQAHFWLLLLILLKNCLGADRTRATQRLLTRIIGEELRIRMEYNIDSYTGNFMHGKLSNVLYTCYPDPTSAYCIYTCRVTHKDHPRIRSASLTCRLKALGQWHTITWLVGISNRCAVVTVDEEVIFNYCYQEASSASSNQLATSSLEGSSDEDEVISDTTSEEKG